MRAGSSRIWPLPRAQRRKSSQGSGAPAGAPVARRAGLRHRRTAQQELGRIFEGRRARARLRVHRLRRRGGRSLPGLAGPAADRALGNARPRRGRRDGVGAARGVPARLHRAREPHPSLHRAAHRCAQPSLAPGRARHHRTQPDRRGRKRERGADRLLRAHALAVGARLHAPRRGPRPPLSGLRRRTASARARRRQPDQHPDRAPHLAHDLSDDAAHRSGQRARRAAPAARHRHHALRQLAGEAVLHGAARRPLLPSRLRAAAAARARRPVPGRRHHPRRRALHRHGLRLVAAHRWRSGLHAGAGDAQRPPHARALRAHREPAGERQQRARGSDGRAAGERGGLRGDPAPGRQRDPQLGAAPHGRRSRSSGASWRSSSP